MRILCKAALSAAFASCILLWASTAQSTNSKVTSVKGLVILEGSTYYLKTKPGWRSSKTWKLQSITQTNYLFTTNKYYIVWGQAIPKNEWSGTFIYYSNLPLAPKTN